MLRRSFLKAAAAVLGGLASAGWLARVSGSTPIPKAAGTAPRPTTFTESFNHPDSTAKLAPEVRTHFTRDVDKVEFIPDGAVRDRGARWSGLGEARIPISHTEPADIIDIYRRFEVSHLRPEKTFRMHLRAGSLTRGSGMIGPGSEVVIRIDWHVEDSYNADETEYILAKVDLVYVGTDHDAIEGTFTKYGHLTR